MSLSQIVSLALSAILIENYIFAKFLGICPYLGVSKKTETAVGMGFAVIFVMGLASAACYLVNTYLLVPLGLEYMQSLAYILVIASLVQFVEMFLMKSIPALYSALGIYLPLITTNCAVLGVAVLNTSSGYNFVGSVLNAVFAGTGFLLAIFLFANVRERTEFSDYPKPFEGFPIALISSSLIAIAFMGFSGLKI